MVQQLRDTITIILVISIILFVLAGILCFCYMFPLIYECIRKRDKIKPLTEKKNNDIDEIKKINMNPLQIEIV